MYFGGDMLNSNKGFLAEFDKEWVQLIMEAKNLGVDISVVKEFLNNNNLKEMSIKN
jgi:DNA-binding transcriptional MerR regulator